MMDQLVSTYVKGHVGSVMENDVFAGGLILLLIGMIGAYLHKAVQLAWCKIKREFIVSIEVRKEDEAFQWLMTWLARHTDSSNGRGLSMLTLRNNRRVRLASPEESMRPYIHFVPAPGLHVYRYRGHWITVQRSVKENQIGGSQGLEVQEVMKLSTFGRDPQILKDLAMEAANNSLAVELGKTIIFQPKFYGFRWRWCKQIAIDKRRIESIHFPPGVMEELIADAREFFDMRTWYHSRSIPYRRGLMLYGPPGCGKSSLAAAIAGELDLNLCVCSLASPSINDNLLQEFLRDIPARSILLLEDIDAAFVQRTKNHGKLTSSGLLNALDGVVAFEGALVIMTTNHLELLDPALTSPGRVDLAVRVGLAQRDQMKRLFRYFYQPCTKSFSSTSSSNHETISEGIDDMAARFAESLPEDRLPMASIQGYLLRHKFNPQAALENAGKFVEQELLRMSQEEHTPEKGRTG